MTNIAMGNVSFIVEFPIKNWDFSIISYVSLPEGTPIQVDIFLEYVRSAGNED